uniref:Uncharacterized protein n=1 Tax=Noctiluca scintillans TaxID=2966 RepID=A0A7S1ADS3_NOCSC
MLIMHTVRIMFAKFLLRETVPPRARWTLRPQVWVSWTDRADNMRSAKLIDTFAVIMSLFGEARRPTTAYSSKDFITAHHNQERHVDRCLLITRIHPTVQSLKLSRRARTKLFFTLPRIPPPLVVFAHLTYHVARDEWCRTTAGRGPWLCK